MLDWLSVDLSAYHLARPQAIWALALVPLFFLLRERDLSGWPRWRSFLAMLLRIAAYTTLVIALAGPHRFEDEPDLSLVAVVDLTGSTDEGRLAGYGARLGALLEEADTDVPVFGFTGDAVVPVEDASQLTELAGSASAGSELGPALEVALSALTPASSQRLALFTDGAVTRGSLRRASAVAQALDVQVFPFPPAGPLLDGEIVGMEVEQGLRVGTSIPVRIQLRANQPAEGELLLRVGSGEPVRQSVTLGPTVSEATLRLPTTRPGILDLDAELVLEGDAFADNNRFAARARVVGRPRGMVIGADNAQALRRALARARPPLELTSRPGSQPPAELDELDLLVLLDPDFENTAPARLEQLSRFVRRGGKLLVTAGPRALAIPEEDPGYEPLRELLPVSFPRTREEQPAPLAIVYLLDASDSMGRSAKFDLGLAGVLASVEVMPPNSQVSVVTYSDFPRLVLPLTPVEQHGVIEEALGRLDVGGGTSVMPGLQQAYDVLRESEALFRHVVLLSDGHSTTRYRSHGTVVDLLARRDISVSTVAISDEADREEMQLIADITDGRHYFTQDYGSLPEIFIDETVNVTRTNAVEETFAVHAVDGSRFLEGVDVDAIPDLHGYVRSAQKPSSELALATEEGQPLLVSWRYGRGAVTTFTSDVAAEWSRDWAEWSPHDRLWQQVVQETLDAETPEYLELTGTVVGERARLRFSVLDATRNPRNDLVVEALLDGSERLAMEPAGPGLYELEFPLPRDRALLAEVAVVGENRRLGGSAGPLPGGEGRISLFRAGSEESAGPTLNLPLLQDLAQDTRGAMAPANSVLLDDGVRSRERRVDEWPPLIWAALILFGVDLTTRRLRLPGGR